MRLTIIPIDKTIGIDGEFLSNIQEDLSWIPTNIHAVQWYDIWGEVEYNDGSPNERIEDLGIFEQAVQTVENERVRLENKRIEDEAKIDYWSIFRSRRNKLLSACDWTQIPDAPLTEEQKEQWRVYRQTLRDLSESIVDPKPLALDLTYSNWPTPPFRFHLYAE